MPAVMRSERHRDPVAINRVQVLKIEKIKIKYEEEEN
jgi:hypothetical protein